MVAGRVVRFDSSRGYGFLAPDHGGEDVFLHVNDMLISEAQVRSGVVLEFEIEDGDRGPKATGVRLPQEPRDRPPAPAAARSTAPQAPPATATPPAAASSPADEDDSLCNVLSAEEFTRELTEVLLEAAPSLTGEQILQIRGGLAQLAKNHGWTEG